MTVQEYYISKFLNENKSLMSDNCLVVISDTVNIKSLRHIISSEAKLVNIKSLGKLNKKYSTVIPLNVITDVLDYDQILVKLSNLLKDSGTIIATVSSLPVNKYGKWGLTLSSAKLVFSKYFNSTSDGVFVYGNALAGRLALENSTSFNTKIKTKLDTVDIHFPVIVGFVGKKKRVLKKSSGFVNILVDEEKESIKGYLASILKRVSYVFDLPLKILRYVRAVITRTLISKDKYMENYNLEPISRNYGFERGRPIDRYYIEDFINENKSLIKGKCLEIVDNTYTLKYGGDKVTKSDALDIFPSKRANIRGDLRNLYQVKSNTYDCLIVTQTYNVIDDYISAIKESHRILKKGGILIVTLPTVSPSWNIKINFWRFSSESCKYVFENIFGKGNVNIKRYGNQKTTTGFWLGLSQEDLSLKEIIKNDESHPLIIGVLAKKV